MKYKALGANIFAGGFTVGVQDFFEPTVHLEHGDYGRNVKDINLPHIETITTPWPQIDGIDFIYANPPCAPFSSAANGRLTPWYRDQRLNCFTDCFNLIYQRPKVLAIESVLNAWRKAPEFLLELSSIANAEGYCSTILLHDGKYLGLPQVRRRMFLVIHEIELAFDKMTFHKEIPCDHALLHPPVTDLENDSMLIPDEHTKYLLMHRTYKDNTLAATHDRLGFRNGKGSKRPAYTSANCRPGRPAPTLIHAMHAHPFEPRFLKTREMARLSGYPDWWDWNIPLGPSGRASLIARGVTPTVGRWLAKLVYMSLDRNRPVKTLYTRIVDVTTGKLSVKYSETG